MTFVHLHNHSEYSLLNGAIRIKDLIFKAKEFDMPAVALTDYGNIFGAVDFFIEAKNHAIKPIIGCTVFLPSHDDHTQRVHRRGLDHLFQLVLLIQNETGYKNLCQLITKSYLDGFYYKPRADTKLLQKFNEGLVALSAGWSGALNTYLFDGQKEKAKYLAKTYSSIFKDRFYVELQENGVEGQHEMNLNLIKLAGEFNLPVVASNNCHYYRQEDAEAFEILQCVQTGATLHGIGDQMKFSTDGYYFKSPTEMAQAFEYCPEAIENTLKIADSVNFEFDLKTYHFPKFEPPKGKALDEYLVEEAWKGLDERWEEIVRQREQSAVGAGLKPAPTENIRKQYEERLKTELATIKQMGFSGYFLIVSDFIRYAKDHDVPVGPGRGSAAGSLVAFCTRITDLDPLPYDLLFERFLNPERISMPDVDIDFCMNKRDQVLQYVTEKYGNVSQIITFGKMKARAVIRDVARVMEMPYDDADKIAKLIPNELNITLNKALEQEPRLKELVDKDPQINRLMEISKRLEGLNRHASTHAAGVVISDKPLTEFLPLYKGSNNDVVTQYDMKAVEKIGLIKFDFLGLKTLTVIDDALKIIKRTRKKEIKILEIPQNDPKVFELLAKGDTSGVFQLESSGMKDLMVRMKPSTFEDMIALVALFRPGPLGSGMVDDFINRKHGKTQFTYDLDQLKPILDDTCGVIVYQEQVMRIASVLAGYSLGEADILRRAMGKKKPKEMAKQRVRFLKGCDENKIPKYKAEKIFDLMAKFAEYGFNKSHSGAYALVSYQTAYLKAHYTVEYLASILTTEMHNTDKVLYYIQDAKDHGIKVLPPNVNECFHGFSVTGEKEMRFGLGAVKNVGQGAIEAIIETRQKNGKFKSFFDFCKRLDFKRVNRRVLESLIKCGAFDTIESNRHAFFEVIDSATSWAVKKQEEAKLGQTSLFGMMGSGSKKPVGMVLPDVEEWPENQKLSFEKEALGFYLTGHPLKVYQAEIRQVSTSDSRTCQHLHNQSQVTLAGIITQYRAISTKKGSRMAFITLEDLKGSLEVIIFPDVYKKCADLLTDDKPVVVHGAIDRTDEGVKIIAKEVGYLTNYLVNITNSVHFKIPAALFTEDRIKLFHNILNEYNGNCRGYIHLIHPEKSETVLELPQGIRLDDSENFTVKVNTLFKEKVVEYSS